MPLVAFGMKFFYLAIGGLAAFRLSLMVSKEDGPAYIFRKIRRLPREDSSAKAGLSCTWCMSIWAGALVTTYLWIVRVMPGIEWPLYWLGTRALRIICNQQWTKEK